MTEENAYDLRNMLNRIKTNFNLLIGIINLNESFIVLQDCLISSVSVTSSVSAISIAFTTLNDSETSNASATSNADAENLND